MNKLALGMILLIGGGVAWRAMRSDAPEPKLLFDRFWVDHEPTQRDEKFKVFFVNGEEPFGRFVDRTTWTGAFELFHYHFLPSRDGELDFLFGRTNERQRIKYTARRCHEGGFDYCLELTGTTRGVQRYYSKRQWDPERDESAFVERLAASMK